MDRTSAGLRLFFLDRDPAGCSPLRLLAGEHRELRLNGRDQRTRWSARLLAENPDVVVVRLHSEEQAALLCRELRARRPSIVCLLLSSEDDVDEALLGALLRGACDVASRVATPPASRADRGSDPLTGLGPQQRRIAQAVARGLTNSQIAAELHLSPYTVRNHLSRVMKHLGAHNRTEVAVAMIQRGEDPAVSLTARF